ncbi:uncharacterized protein BDZ99DRAFT_566154 [Mytilinidion resinicola]|uniref:CCHC-type domain-containing protein n=1 Tax=Mytilinidion resinicola TaxID=574789 RepID=A0A6A6Z5B3_9PEZI|nr:uncharacterized protein BDZ99DRAFT_566154 [Mytilinidion resinicola]KAF2816312.1 hypothetical protein BDZ99DRAFT_566154 [Mytilinidion resinicola]
MSTSKEPKIMSSRLLTMKFMQRSTVKNSSPTSSTGPSTPISNGPHAKRQRLSSGSYTPTPSSDYVAMQAALAAEEAKRSEAVERQAAEVGETRWVLSFRDDQAARGKVQMRVVQAGFAEIDGQGDEESSDEESGFGAGGRMRFGKGKKAQVTNSSADKEESSDSDEKSDPLDSDPDGDPTDALIRSAQARADRKAKKQAAKAEAVKMAEARRRKEVNLNQNKGRGISSGGGLSMANTARGVTCHGCGQEGHMMRDCPKNTRRRIPEERWKANQDLKILR